MECLHSNASLSVSESCCVCVCVWVSGQVSDIHLDLEYMPEAEVYSVIVTITRLYIHRYCHPHLHLHLYLHYRLIVANLFVLVVLMALVRPLLVKQDCLVIMPVILHRKCWMLFLIRFQSSRNNLM